MANLPLNPARPRKSTKAADAAPRSRKSPKSRVSGGAPGRHGAPVSDGAGSEGTELPDRRAMIALAAYYRAERRGFAPGHEQEDWLAAEREVDAALAPSHAARPAGAASAAERGPPN